MEKLPFTTIFLPSSKLSHWPTQMSALDPTEIRGRRKSTELHPGCITHFCISDILKVDFLICLFCISQKKTNISVVTWWHNLHCHIAWDCTIGTIS